MNSARYLDNGGSRHRTPRALLPRQGFPVSESESSRTSAPQPCAAVRAPRYRPAGRGRGRRHSPPRPGRRSPERCSRPQGRCAGSAGARRIPRLQQRPGGLRAVQCIAVAQHREPAVQPRLPPRRCAEPPPRTGRAGSGAPAAAAPRRAQPSPVQPSRAQPSRVQPSRAEPSPAEPPPGPCDPRATAPRVAPPPPPLSAPAPGCGRRSRSRPAAARCISSPRSAT